MAGRAMGTRAVVMGAMAIGARGGLLQQQPRPRGGDQCRDVRGPALKLGRGEPASRGAEPIHLGRARRTAEQAGIAARASNPINPVVAGTGGGLINAGESKQGGSSMLESRSRHLSRWLRTSVCAIAQQGSARGSAVRVSVGLDMRMGGCGSDTCIGMPVSF